MAYYPLGFRPAAIGADTTGLNTGNYTATFDSDVLGITVPVFEVYHLYLTAPTLASGQTTATVMINRGYWDVTLIGQANSWDPSQPALMTPGDALFVLFNVPTSNTVKPTAYAWFRREI